MTGLSLLMAFAGYFLSVILEMLHTLILCSIYNNGHIHRTGAFQRHDNFNRHYQSVLRFHPLYLSFSCAAAGVLYAVLIRNAHNQSDTDLIIAGITGAVWMVVCIILDVIEYFLRRPAPCRLDFGRLGELQYQRRIIPAYLFVWCSPIFGLLIC